MSLTTHYGFNKPIGSDLVNPLTDTFPNWDIVDSTLFELDERSIANCTEVVSLGVHAISRLDTNTKFLKWIATANFTAGDTFTVDGNVVSAATASGEALSTDAYVSGAVILACLNADDSAMTIYVTGTNVASDSSRLGGELPSYYATAADMSNAQNDIINIQNLEGNTSIVGIGDGTLTGAVSTLNSSVTNKDDKPEVISGTVPAYDANGVKLADLPTGFTVANSYIVSAEYKHTNGYSYPLTWYNGTTSSWGMCNFKNDGIYLVGSANHSAWGQSFKVVMKKY